NPWARVTNALCVTILLAPALSTLESLTTSSNSAFVLKSCGLKRTSDCAQTWLAMKQAPIPTKWSNFLTRTFIDTSTDCRTMILLNSLPFRAPSICRGFYHIPRRFTSTVFLRGDDYALLQRINKVSLANKYFMSLQSRFHFHFLRYQPTFLLRRSDR